MSYGFYRKGKPNARRLTNLRIEEISSVDRGAAHGAQIKLMKRESPVSDVTVEKSIADEVNIVMKTLTDAGVGFAEAASVAHRAERAYKAALLNDDQLEKADDHDDGRPWSAERLMKRANELQADYQKLGKPKRSLNSFIDDAIAEAQGRNPKPVSP